MYHVRNRGDPREDSFRDDEDRQRFRSTLGEAGGKTEWQAPGVLPDAQSRAGCGAERQETGRQKASSG